MNVIFLQYLGPVYTMNHEVGPWKMAFFEGPMSMVRFLKKINLQSHGLSLGVNRI